LLIDPGPLGTTCARVGCMPSKALIHAADTFHNRRFFDDLGIAGSGMLVCDPAIVLKHVRRQRDRFAGGMVKTTQELAGDRLICARAKLLDEHRIQAGEEIIRAKRIILAVGGEPVVPDDWKPFSDRVLTSETVFEQESLPKKIAVIGLGPVGLELGQALSRMGLNITGFSLEKNIGGLSDPKINRELVQQMEQEFPLYTGSPAEVSECEDRRLCVRFGEQEVKVDAVLAAMGISPNLKGIGLENLGVDPENISCDPHTGQLGDRPVYVVGDANGIRPILHEALDEGALAATHALDAEPSACGCRRVPLRIAFSDPEIAVVGTSYKELPEGVVTGVAGFNYQARAVIEHRNTGRIHLYAEKQTGKLLGAELCAPDAGWFGHWLALAVQRRCTVFDLLEMPFYHPTLAEALRTALRDAAEQCDESLKTGTGFLTWCCTEKPLA
jgi:dihydrolipoamide dehydrogenase